MLFFFPRNNPYFRLCRCPPFLKLHYFYTNQNIAPQPACCTFFFKVQANLSLSPTLYWQVGRTTTHTQTHTHTHTCTHTHTHTHTHTSASLHHVCTHIHTHTHTYLAGGAGCV